MRDLHPTHFNWRLDGSIAVISLARPERKNPLTFDSYAELRDTFRGLALDEAIKAVVIAPNGGIPRCPLTTTWTGYPLASRFLLPASEG